MRVFYVCMSAVVSRGRSCLVPPSNRTSLPGRYHSRSVQLAPCWGPAETGCVPVDVCSTPLRTRALGLRPSLRQSLSPSPSMFLLVTLLTSLLLILIETPVLALHLWQLQLYNTTHVTFSSAKLFLPPSNNPQRHRRNNRRDRGRLVPQLLGWWTNSVLVPQLLGRSFRKARNFTASSHQNAGFSI